MAILSFASSPSKNSTTEVTLNKSQLYALAPISGDAFWSDPDNIAQVSVNYESTIGRQNKSLNFDAQTATPTDSISFSSIARDSFQIDTIILRDFDGGKFIISRATLSSLVTIAELDIELIVLPSEIGDIVIWLDAEDLALSNGSSVTSWTDKNSHAFSVVSYAPHNPIYITSWSNGKPCVRFEEVMDARPTYQQYMYMTTKPNDFVVNAEMTIFVVGRFGTLNSAKKQLYVNISGTPYEKNMEFKSNDSGDNTAFYRWTTGTIANKAYASVNSGSNWTGTSPTYVAARYSASSGITIKKDGQTQTITQANPLAQINYSNSWLDFGPRDDNSRLDADYAEIIIFNKALSDIEMTQVENYLASKYGI